MRYKVHPTCRAFMSQPAVTYSLIVVNFSNYAQQIHQAHEDLPTSKPILSTTTYCMSYFSKIYFRTLLGGGGAMLPPATAVSRLMPSMTSTFLSPTSGVSLPPSMGVKLPGRGVGAACTHITELTKA